MTTTRRRSGAAHLCLCLGLLLGAPGFGGGALAAETAPAAPAGRQSAADQAPFVAQDFYEALFDTMRHASELKMKGRYERLYPVMTKLFDVPTMTRIAVGSAFTELTPEQQAALRDAFARLLVATFASTFDDFKGETYAVEDTLLPQGQDRLVKTRFNGEGAPVPINFLMRKKGDEWKVVDIYLNGNISQLATWRSEYASTFDQKGYDGLMAAIQAQIDKDMKAF